MLSTFFISSIAHFKKILSTALFIIFCQQIGIRPLFKTLESPLNKFDSSLAFAKGYICCYALFRH